MMFSEAAAAAIAPEIGGASSSSSNSTKVTRIQQGMQSSAAEARKSSARSSTRRIADKNGGTERQDQQLMEGKAMVMVKKRQQHSKVVNSSSAQQEQEQDQLDEMHKKGQDEQHDHSKQQQQQRGRGLYLLKLAKNAQVSGDNPAKALDHATRAGEMLRACSSPEWSLELIMSSLIVAAAQCRMGSYRDAIATLEATVEQITAAAAEDEQQQSELWQAAFAGLMQLGDAYATLGEQDAAMDRYARALELQKASLGDMHPRVGETCRYLAEAYAQAMRLDEAEALCEEALRIHEESGAPPGCRQEALDRRLLALIHSGNGRYDRALEQLSLAAAATSTAAPLDEQPQPPLDAAVGDCYAALGNLDAATLSYHAALEALGQQGRARRRHRPRGGGEGEEACGARVAAAATHASLAELALAAGRRREAREHCDSALVALQCAGGAAVDVAAALARVAGTLHDMAAEGGDSEDDEVAALLRRAGQVIAGAPDGQQRAAAGVQAQLGLLFHDMGRFEEGSAALMAAASALQRSGASAALLGDVLNQAGVALLGKGDIHGGVQALQQAHALLAQAYGARHSHTLSACSNLAAGYDALGRVDDAIELLDKVLQCQEATLGTAHPDVVEVRSRLQEMLKEVGRPLLRKTRTLEELLMLPRWSMPQAPKKSFINLFHG